MGKQTRLLHYGLQRSGTNFLETVLKRKYRVRFLNSDEDRRSPLQKHFRLYDEKEIVSEPQYYNELKTSTFHEFEQFLEVIPDYYLVISKDPYSWLLSYRDWALKCSWPQVSHHYIVEYNLFYKSWLEFSLLSERVLFVRYIDLLEDAEGELGRLESIMSLDKKFLSRFNPTRVTKVPMSKRFSDEQRNYYLGEEYFKSYTREVLDEINRLIDPEVLAGLGYERKEVE